MRVVLDTNVLVSGVFFGGVPGRILEAWRDGELTVVLSPSILEEYDRVGAVLAAQYPGVDLKPVLGLLAVHGDVVHPAALREQVCSDPDDDKFLACALAGRADVVVSGDRALRHVSGWEGVDVMTPRAFADRYL